MNILITGGAGFIGSTLVKHLLSTTKHTIINVDSLTYASNLDSLDEAANHPNYNFAQADILDDKTLDKIFEKYRPDAVMHLAAESHVDRSIDGPAKFMQTNIIGTYQLLETSLAYWQRMDASRRNNFRFLHVSTDEVFGDLVDKDDAFSESTPYAPNSPYSASKASADHLVRAWHRTFELPVLVTNCSNNYGPYHFPEKLIPLTIINALQGKSLPIYGNGEQIRDWLYVEDHVRALFCVLENGRVGETYNIGGNNQKRNIDVVHAICDVLEEIRPLKPSDISGYRELIRYVDDRPGHDLHYAIDSSKINAELEWYPQESFDSGLKKTVSWFLENEAWWMKIQKSTYRGQRLGRIQKS